jgi:hypothetical protein
MSKSSSAANAIQISPPDHLAHQSSRWERLERYARWKQNKLPLHLLPDEVVALIATFLQRRDAYNLVESLLGFQPNIFNRDDVARIPLSIQPLWIESILCDLFEQRVYALAEVALYYARDASSVVMLLDWSLFSNVPAVPVAEYHWIVPCIRESTHTETETGTEGGGGEGGGLHVQIPSLARIQVLTNHATIKTKIAEMMRHRTCGVRLTLHRRTLLLDQFSVIDPRPLVNDMYIAVPHTLYSLLQPTCNDKRLSTRSRTMHTSTCVASSTRTRRKKVKIRFNQS